MASRLPGRRDVGFDRLALVLLILLALTRLLALARLLPGADVLVDLASLACAVRITMGVSRASFRITPSASASYEIVARALKNGALR